MACVSVIRSIIILAGMSKLAESRRAGPFGSFNAKNTLSADEVEAALQKMDSKPKPAAIATDVCSSSGMVRNKKGELRTLASECMYDATDDAKGFDEDGYIQCLQKASVDLMTRPLIPGGEPQFTPDVPLTGECARCFADQMAAAYDSCEAQCSPQKKKRSGYALMTNSLCFQCIEEREESFEKCVVEPPKSKPTLAQGALAIDAAAPLALGAGASGGSDASSTTSTTTTGAATTTEASTSTAATTKAASTSTSKTTTTTASSSTTTTSAATTTSFVAVLGSSSPNVNTTQQVSGGKGLMIGAVGVACLAVAVIGGACFVYSKRLRREARMDDPYASADSGASFWLVFNSARNRQEPPAVDRFTTPRGNADA